MDPRSNLRHFSVFKMKKRRQTVMHSDNKGNTVLWVSSKNTMNGHRGNTYVEIRLITLTAMCVHLMKCSHKRREFEIMFNHKTNCWDQYQKKCVDTFSTINIKLMFYLRTTTSWKSRWTTKGAVERDFPKKKKKNLNNLKHVTNIFHVNLKAIWNIWTVIFSNNASQMNSLDACEEKWISRVTCVGHMHRIFKPEICLRTNLMKGMKCDGYQCMVFRRDIIFTALQPALFFQLESLEGNKLR